MADCCPDSKLSTAANIIGLLTFTLSALNLLIVRVLRNESKIIKQLRKGGWKNSLNALEQKIRYIRLFNPAFAGFGRDNMHPDHASGIPRVPDVGAPGERSDLEEKQPEERFTEILKDVQRCYDQGKVTINETEAIQHLLAEQISLAGYARATRRLILRWDVENFYEASVSVCRQLYNWRESREAVDKLEDNYQECKCTPVDFFPFTLEHKSE